MLLEPLPDRRKAGAVDGAGTELAQRLLVGRGPVSLVSGKVVPRVAVLQLAQEGVSGGLGQDRGRRDAQRAGIAFDQRGLRKVDGGQDQVIQEQVLQEMGLLQRLDGAHGCQTGSREDAFPVDLLAGGEANPPVQRGCPDAGRPPGALFGGHLLGIADAVQELFNVGIRGEDDDRGRDRSGPGASPGLVHAPDAVQPGGPQRLLETQIRPVWQVGRVKCLFPRRHHNRFLPRGCGPGRERS